MTAFLLCRLALLISLSLIPIACTLIEPQDNSSSASSAPSSPSSQNQPNALNDQFPEHPPGSDSAKPIVISAEELVKEFGLNHLRFAENYTDRWVKLDGTVRYISDDSIALEELFSASHRFSDLHPVPPDLARDNLLMDVSVGESTTVICFIRKSGMVRNYYILEMCHFPAP